MNRTSINKLITVLFLFSGTLYASQLLAQISGPSTSNTNTNVSYSFVDDSPGTSKNWNIINGTSVSQSQSGTTYNITLKWTCPGTGTLQFRNGSTVLASKDVSVNCGVIVRNPGGSFTYNVQCQSVVITRTSTPPAGHTWYWQTSPDGTRTDLGSGPSLTVTSPGTYYLRAQNSCCWGSASLATNPVELGTPDLPAVSDASICAHGGQVTLAATAGARGTTVRWYDAPSGGTLQGEGSSFVTPSFMGTITFYACSYNGNAGCESGRVPVTGTTWLPAAPAGTDNSRCGGGQVSISASPASGGNSIRWYDAPSGGSLLAEGTSFLTPSIGGSTTFYATTYNSSVPGCESGSRAAVTTTITFPNTPSITDGSRCGEGSVTLSGSSGSGGTTLRWYAAPSGGTALGEGTSFATPSIPATTTFYASSYNPVASTCESSRVAVTATVTHPSTPLLTAGSRCSTGQVNLSGSPGSGGTTVRWYAASSGGSTLGEGTSFSTPSISGTTTYYASTFNPVASTCESGRIPVVATVEPLPTTPSSASSSPADLCAAGSITLSASGAGAGEDYVWYNVPNGGSPLSSATQSIATTSSFYVSKRKIAYGCEGPRTEVTIPIYSAPEISVSGPTDIPYGGSTQLMSSASFAYQWMLNGADIAGATNSTLSAKEPGSYSVKVRNNSASSLYCPSASQVIRGALITQPLPVNYVSTTHVLKQGVNGATSLYTLQPEELSQTIHYMDGLGRNFQTIIVGQSPQSGDIVLPMVYGIQGKPDTTYLPYTTSSRDGRLRSNAVRSEGAYSNSEQYSFYQNTAKVTQDAYPYAIAKYFSTPEARIHEQGAPGFDWQPAQAHTRKQIRSVNSENTIRLWKPDGTTTSYYNANELLMSIVTDENGNQERVFIDKMGRVVLKQTQLDENIDDVFVPYLETYYIYDIYGQLIYQLPPKAVAALGGGSSLDANAAAVAELIFKYKYDDKGRLIEKKVPGAAVQYLVYDKYDHLVLMQDGNLRSLNKWLFIKYDILKRPVYNGLYTNSGTRSEVQLLFDSRNLDAEPWYEEEENNATFHGYSNNAFPASELELLNVMYYDSYDFNRNSSPDYAYDNTHLSGLPSVASALTRGLPTGKKTKVLGTSNWLTSVVFYDDFDRPLQVQSNNHLNLASLQDKQSVLYDFSGKTLKTNVTHITSAETIHQQLRYTYDHAGRPTAIFEAINGSAEQQVVAQEYNALGQLIDKKLHNNGGTFLQSIDYRYNIRGWLSSINNSQLTANSANNDESNDYFGMEFLYNTPEAGLNNQSGDKSYYNGNIAAIKWKGPGAGGSEDQRSYKMKYDKSNKLLMATFQANDGFNWTREANTLNENMTYDHNGNIRSLVRKENQRSLALVDDVPTVTSVSEDMDNLLYTYALGNQLNKVEDNSGNDRGFKNGATADDEFTYNAEGSAIKDGNKSITNISYNELGKPSQIDFEDGSQIQYTYDASGNKLTQKLLRPNVASRTTDYVNGFIYEDGSLRFFGSPEGRIVKNGSDFEYQYAIADHLGNTRVVFSANMPAATAITATFEGDANDNSDQFHQVANVVTFVGANHTSAGSQVGSAGHNIYKTKNFIFDP